MTKYAYVLLILAPLAILGLEATGDQNITSFNEANEFVKSVRVDGVGSENSEETLQTHREAIQKSFRMYTTSVNGEKSTTMWYYNSAGPNYKFTVVGGPPEPREHMIDWLEKNSRLYKVTPVPYLGDAEEKPSAPEPTSASYPSLFKPRSTTEFSISHEDNLHQMTVRLPKKNTATRTLNPFASLSALLPKECGWNLDARRIIGGKASHISGSPWQSDDAEEHTIAQLFVHEGYNDETYIHDIALIAIDGDFVFGLMISPICMPTQDESFHPGRRCKISGWGRTVADDEFSDQNVLRSTFVEITTKKECKSFNQEDDAPITSGMVCAGNFKEGGVDTCEGDSGGPLACAEAEAGRYRLLGVTSWGRGCGDKHYPGVYTKVTEYVKWIKDKIEVSIRSTLNLEDDYEESDNDYYYYYPQKKILTPWPNPSWFHLYHPVLQFDYHYISICRRDVTY